MKAGINPLRSKIGKSILLAIAVATLFMLARPDTAPVSDKELTTGAEAPSPGNESTPESAALPQAPSSTALSPTALSSNNEPKRPARSCVQLHFRHKAMAGHPDREKCAAHRNLISLGTPRALADMNWKSVCLRVDGVVTPFDRNPTGITFGPLAGPDSKVVLNYCRGNTACPTRCTPPRDTFLDAIGASLKREKNVPTAIAKWDPADREEEPDPTLALEAELRDGNGVEHGLSLFKDWTVTSRTAGCGSTVARVN